MYPKPIPFAELSAYFQSVPGLYKSSQLPSNGKPNEGDPKQGMVEAITTDSRLVRPGSVFVAIRGHARDGHDFIPEVLAAGASLIISDKPLGSEVPHICVADSRQAWAYLEDLRYGHPGRYLKLVGVTGTNGKSSVVWMVSHLLQALGKKSVMIGTLGTTVSGVLIPSAHTTPDPDYLYKILREAVDSGVEFVSMEVSSQSIVHGRVSPLSFAGALFTSFSRDHLDFHSSMEHYFEAKLQLFSKLTSNAVKLMHEDIVYTMPAYKACIDKLNTQFYSLSSSLSGVEYTPGFLSWTAKDGGHKAPTPYLGELANSNLLASVLTVSQITGESLGRVMSQVPSLPQVPGRFEFVGKSKGGGLVYVDYAHTPDAITKACVAVKDANPGMRLRILFGCGGDRDPGKRPLMGAAAAKECEIVYLTSDNPRSEDPKKIMDDIYQGCLSVSPGAEIVVEGNREEAIRKAVSSLGALSVLLIAGKGHETYQLIQGQKLPFDDREIAKKYLSS
jgi:UDP-N-acetylmuramoyl-L-alanyl-D-glutamate--2,6-diaminopimelate ligase